MEGCDKAFTIMMCCWALCLLIGASIYNYCEYCITSEAIKNGYVQKRVDGKHNPIWVKEQK